MTFLGDGLGGVIGGAGFTSAAARPASSVTLSGPALNALAVATERWDPDNVHDPGVPSRFTIPPACRVHAWAAVRVPGTGVAGVTFIRVQVGVSGTAVAEYTADRETVTEIEITAVAVAVLAAGQYLQALAGCDAASTPATTVPAQPDERAPELMAELSSFTGTQLRANADQSLPASTLTAIALQVSVFDDGGWGNTGTGKITVPATARYLVTGRAQWAATNDGGGTLLGIQINGAGALFFDYEVTVDTSGFPLGMTFMLVLALSANDTVALLGDPQTAAALSVIVANGVGAQLTVERDTATGTHAYQSGTVSTTSGTLTAIALNNELWDDGNWHDNATNNTRITVPTTGRYRVMARANWAANTAGYRACYVRKNGTDYVLGKATKPNPNGSVTSMSISGLVDCIAGDYLELVTLQTSGIALNIDGSGGNYAVCLQVETAP